MPKYIKKPVIINAVQNDGAWKTIVDWLAEIQRAGIRISHNLGVTRNMNGSLNVRTLEGNVWAQIGDWVICNVNGELSKCTADEFEATYELF